MPELFADHVFWPQYNSTHSSFLVHVSLVPQQYSSNVAAVTRVGRMMSLLPHLQGGPKKVSHYQTIQKSY